MVVSGDTPVKLMKLARWRFDKVEQSGAERRVTVDAVVGVHLLHGSC